MATAPRVLPADQQARHLATRRVRLSLTEGLHTTPIPRVNGPTGDRTAIVTAHPFLAPHNPVSDMGRIGGGHVPRPGEVSLAHNGVRCPYARPACRRHVLGVLR